MAFRVIALTHAIGLIYCTGSSCALQVGDSNDIDDRREYSKAESNDQNQLLLSRKSQLGQNGDRQEKYGDVCNDVDGRGRQVYRDDAEAFGAAMGRKLNCCTDGVTLEDVDQG